MALEVCESRIVKGLGIVSLCLGMVVITSCGADSSQPTGNHPTSVRSVAADLGRVLEVPSAAAAEAEGRPTLMIYLENAIGQPGLERLNQRRHIYSFSDDRAWIQFSFERRPFDDADALEAIRETFEYCDVEIRFPERGTENTRVYAQLRGPLRDLDAPRSFDNIRELRLSFTAYDQGRLRGTIQGALAKLTTETRDPRLRSGDIAGVGHSDEEVDIPFVIDFDLSVGE